MVLSVALEFRTSRFFWGPLNLELMEFAFPGLLQTQNVNYERLIDKNMCVEFLEITVLEMIVKNGPADHIEIKPDFPSFANKLLEMCTNADYV